MTMSFSTPPAAAMDQSMNDNSEWRVRLLLGLPAREAKERVIGSNEPPKHRAVGKVFLQS